jgi:hypothetical protein
MAATQLATQVLAGRGGDFDQVSVVIDQETGPAEVRCQTKPKERQGRWRNIPLASGSLPTKNKECSLVRTEGVTLVMAWISGDERNGGAGKTEAGLCLCWSTHHCAHGSCRRCRHRLQSAEGGRILGLRRHCCRRLKNLEEVLVLEHRCRCRHRLQNKEGESGIAAICFVTGRNID